MDTRVHAAVVLAGGAGRRLGGPGKPTLPVAGRPMLAGVLAAVRAAAPRVVVGPPDLRAVLPPGVRVTQEQPPGGGPVAALVAGLAALDAPGPPVDGAEAPAVVVVLAADLPLLTAAAVQRLVWALGARPASAGVGGPDGPDGPYGLDGFDRPVGPDGPDGAVYVDGTGRPQWLCGAWSLPALRSRCAELARSGPVAGRSLRELVAPLRVVEVVAAAGEPPPWYDCDTPDQVRAAEALGRPGDRPGTGRATGPDLETGGRS